MPKHKMQAQELVALRERFRGLMSPSLKCLQEMATTENTVRSVQRAGTPTEHLSDETLF